MLSPLYTSISCFHCCSHCGILNRNIVLYYLIYLLIIIRQIYFYFTKPSFRIIRLLKRGNLNILTPSQMNILSGCLVWKGVYISARTQVIDWYKRGEISEATSSSAPSLYNLFPTVGRDPQGGCQVFAGRSLLFQFQLIRSRGSIP